MLKNAGGLAENTVPADNQLKGNPAVYYDGDGGLRVLIAGNSITRHAPAPELGWDGDWGMAASAKEKDYVHILMGMIRGKFGAARFCVAQLAEAEQRYREIDAVLAKFGELKAFRADIAIVRLSENARIEKDGGREAFRAAYEKTLGFLSGGGAAALVVGTGFWRNPDADAAIREAAGRFGAAVAELGDLGERDENKAVGLFAHGGVAAHPGDTGMRAIAERLFGKILSARNARRA
ncbi:MAG: hypothetical protein LBL66_06000 [Clostridiales bacterium]|jgi:hypothetical protein|nr:hypothetical protein [Clostridiales bacterium]